MIVEERSSQIKNCGLLFCWDSFVRYRAKMLAETGAYFYNKNNNENISYVISNKEDYMPSLKKWLKKTFGGEDSNTIQSQIPSTLRSGFAAAEMPDLEEKALLSHEDVHKLLMSVSANYNDDPRLETIVEDYFAYNRIYEAKVPPKSEPDFMKKAAEINRRIMESNERLISSLSEAAADYIQRGGQERTKKDADRELAERYEKMGVMLKKLAEHTLGQQAAIANAYDRVMEIRHQDASTSDGLEGKTFNEIFTDTRVYRKGEMEGKTLGQGGMNTVYKVHVDGKERVFKQGSGSIRSLDEYATDVDVYRERLGAEVEQRTLSDGTTQFVLKDVETAKRDVAVSRVDQLFGFDIAVGTRLVRSETGELSSLMELSSGQEITKFALISDPTQEQAIRAFQKNGYEGMIQMLQHAVESKKKNGESQDLIRANEEELQMWVKEKETKSANPVICIRDSDLNKSLMEMAALDYICTHMDRHVGNYMVVQQDGKFRVQAIDNDTAFARVEEGRMGGSNAPEVNLEDNFPFVDAELKEKIQAITPQTLRDSLTGLLKEDQITVACERLKKMQEHFEKIEVVTGDFTPEQIDKLLDSSKSMTSYNAHLTQHTAEKDKTVREWARKTPEYYETLLPQEVAAKRAIAESKAKKEAEKMTFAQFSKETAEKEPSASKKDRSQWKKVTPTKSMEKEAPVIGANRTPKR